MIEKIKFLFAHKNFMKYFKNTSWLFGEKILRMIFGFFVGIWLVRYLGPEKFGILSYSQSFVGLFAVFSSLGLDNILVKELVKNNFNSEKLLISSFILKLIGTSFMIVFISIALNFTQNDSYNNLLIFIISVTFFFQSFDVIDFYFQSKVLSKYIVIANICILLISTILKIIFIFLNAELIDFVSLLLVDSVLLAASYIYCLLKFSSINLKKFILSDLKIIFLIKESWPLALTGLAYSIYIRVDQVMIRHFIGSEAVGIYSAGTKLSEIWYFIPAIVVSSIFPAIIKTKMHDEELFNKRMQRLYDFIVLIALAIIIPITFFSDFIVHLLYGKEYNGSGTVLLIHVWSLIFVFLGTTSSKWYLVESKEKLLFWRAFCGMILNVTLNFILIPIYGIIGGALATLFSQALASYFFDLFNHETRILFYMKTKSLFFTQLFKKF